MRKNPLRSVFEKRPVCSILLERGLVARALGFPVGDDRFAIAALRERSNPQETGAEEPREHLIPLRIQEVADRSDAKGLEARRGLWPDSRKRPQRLWQQKRRFPVRFDDGKPVGLRRIGGNLGNGFSRRHGDGASQAGGLENRVLHQLREESGIRMPGLEVRSVGVELIDTAPFGHGEQPVRDPAHVVMQTTVQRPVWRDQQEVRASSQGLRRRHRRPDTEGPHGIACGGDDASGRRASDGDRLAQSGSGL